jgi:hypothetical protein
MGQSNQNGEKVQAKRQEIYRHPRMPLSEALRE